MSRKKTLRETLESLEEEKVEEQRRQKYDNASFADETLGGAFGKPQDRGRFGDLSRGGRPRGKDRGWAAEPEQYKTLEVLDVARRPQQSCRLLACEPPLARLGPRGHNQ